MKRKAIVISLLASTILVGKGVLAAPVKDNVDIPTDGVIKFTTKTNPGEGEVHQPDELGQEPEVIVPEGGSQGSGLLRIQYVPDFNFVAAEGITAAARTEPIAFNKYVFKGETEKHTVPAFVQVTDERGLSGAEAGWVLSVKATPFEIGTTGEVLNNIKLKLNQSTLTMDYKTSAQAAAFIEGQAKSAEILTDGTTETEVLKTKDNQSTNGYQVSNVFYDGYEKDAVYSGTNSGVEFVKPAGQAPLENKVYKSTLQWTLKDAL